jgi:hypothetical protein
VHVPDLGILAQTPKISTSTKLIDLRSIISKSDLDLFPHAGKRLERIATMVDHHRRFNKGSRTSIKIELCEYHARKPDFYTTGDSIEGYVWITIDYLLGPGMVEVAFRGKYFYSGLHVLMFRS